MPKEIPPQYNPREHEERIYRMWEESGFFNPDRLPTRSALGSSKGRQKTYTIAIPPPNVTGSLHMGHALNATIQDILIRKKRMEGYKTLWLPGTDHAGIATQNVVEKELKKQGISRHDLGREKFLEKVWEWKEKYGYIILDQFKKLGSSMDWSRTRFTMDSDYQKAVTEAFLYYHKKGWIYRATRVINWCTRCATSLSDLELEYKKAPDKLYYINYPFADGGGHITVATTRPETMLGDTAVAVNPKDERFRRAIGREVILPIQNRKIPVIADRTIDKTFGTGAVKVTPAHDITDAEIGERHKLAAPQVIDARGRMTKKAGAICEGLKVGECREKVVVALREEHALEKEETYTHNVAVCYRCGTVIEPIPSLQWFVKMSSLAKKAMAAVKSGKVTFHPKRWEKIYFDWLAHIRDWTISRQIWWGHRIPVWFHAPQCIPIPGREKEVERCETFLVADKKPKCAHCMAEFTQSEEVLDTWFSSALWPFATLGWPIACAQIQNAKIPAKGGSASGGKNQNDCRPLRGSDLEKFYPTQTLSTARDIINLWIARMIFSGLEFTKKPPFKDVIIHATILTKDGKRMSKSLGTGVDPMTLIDQHGADATRFGLIWQAMGTQDIRWAEEHVVAGKKFANKIWNASRFTLMQVGEGAWPTDKKPTAKTSEDRRILSALTKTAKTVDTYIERYEFGPALHTIHDFFWHDFCDRYIEKTKEQLKDPKQETATKAILVFTLAESLKLLHPFMPFVTETVWGHMPLTKKELLILESWPA